ncbi:hypothetical protein [Streptomyces iconiensis]|uniref:DoxX family membrane protein n=1 Tax=Streptomyces iconiensis TaxID=1384038 RepID=A0ABT7A2E1_9ACTN|nr:hypothetical protein [Streptomyces iconiensis]MDJ1135490.1 hypothetical protein [Streptomyces iconiensis]
MAVQGQQHRSPGLRLLSLRRQKARVTSEGRSAAMATTAPARVLAGVRLLTGFVFLWAFFDKTFGWGYATPSGQGWVQGGSPTKGFLSGVTVGPMESTFHNWAGNGWVDSLFMLGLLGIGIALAGGILLRLSAVAGTFMMALMWIAEWPPAKHLSDGSPSMSTNPFADYHLVYAAVLVLLAVLYAGRAWGLGAWWERLPFIRRHRWLL